MNADAELQRPQSGAVAASRPESLGRASWEQWLPPLACASVLIGAATLKSYQLLTDPFYAVRADARFVQALLILAEFLLGAWTLSRLYATWCRRTLLATFVVFAIDSLYQAVQGAESCGCFGPVQVHPLVSLLVDAVCLSAAWWWNPVAGKPGRATGQDRMLRIAAALPVVAGLGVASCAVLAYPAAVDGISRHGSIVVLEPKQWIGNRLPILDKIDIGSQLVRGEWLVVFVHHDCPKCQQALRVCQEGASPLPAGGRPQQVAIIEVPPYDRESLGQLSACTHGRLADDSDWFIATPSALDVREGEVVGVLSEDELLPP